MLNAALDLPEDTAHLKALIAQLQAENAKLTTTLRAHDLVVQALRLQIAKLKKQAFGKSSEKIQREIAQLELALEDVLVSVAQQGLVASNQDDPDAEPAAACADNDPVHSFAISSAVATKRSHDELFALERFLDRADLPLRTTQFVGNHGRTDPVGTNGTLSEVHLAAAVDRKNKVCQFA